MKKILIILSVFLLVGCTNKVENEKIAYLEYKRDLEKKEVFNEEEYLGFNIYFNIDRVSEEIVEYSLIIDEPTINMNNVKALLIHDYTLEDAFPTVGIFDDKVNLKSDSNDRIMLIGKIQTLEDISDTRFKLYLEYQDDDNNINKIYYKVKRG